MNGDVKVVFTLRISLSGCQLEDEFTLDELGYDPKFDTDLDEFLEKEWIEWRNDRLDGFWRVVTDE